MFFSCLLVFFVVVNVSSAGKIILFVFIAYQKAFDLIDLACNYVNYTSSIIMVSKKGARSISKLALRPYTNLAISKLLYLIMCYVDSISIFFKCGKFLSVLSICDRFGQIIHDAC